jgi:hypothetical protein
VGADDVVAEAFGGEIVERVDHEEDPIDTVISIHAQHAVRGPAPLSTQAHVVVQFQRPERALYASGRGRTGSPVWDRFPATIAPPRRADESAR